VAIVVISLAAAAGTCDAQAAADGTIAISGQTRKPGGPYREL